MHFRLSRYQRKRLPQRHFNECVARAGFSSGQLTEHVKEYGETHPEMRSKPASSALLAYLISLCGLPAAPPPGPGN